jgi:tetrapyrrole methylase family protein/MazG family protein
MEPFLSEFSGLVTTIRKLRGKNGCPWDKKQTIESLEKYLNEEFEEIIQAIDTDDPGNLCEELGDFLYLIIMLAEISQKNKHFDLGDVIRGINEKLTRRHPHVFGDAVVTDEKSLRQQWRRIKAEEKADQEKT